MATYISYWTGKQIGDFVVEEPIGRGGTATVYTARQRSVDRQVALKIIELQPGEEEYLKRFTREAEVIAMLEHIHILPIYGYGVVDNEAAYFAMRLLNEGTLADILRRGALPLDDAIDVFTQIASGLQYIHTRGVIHRDLKPSNILLDDNGNAYLSDFGLAHVVDVTVNFSDKATHLAGSPAYLAPEVIEGQAADHRSDIYSLGCILYETLCGHPPFETAEGSISAILYKQMRELPPSLREINPAIPAPIEAVVMRALSKNPRERYASAEEMAHELRGAALRSPVNIPHATRRIMPGLLRRRINRRQALYAALLISIFSLIVVLAFVTLQQKNSPAPMNIIEGARATPDEVFLSDAEIGQARLRLGSNGFIAEFPCTMSSAYQTTVARHLQEMAAQYDLPLRIFDSSDDPSRQITMVEQARIEGAKAFILCPLGEPLFDATIRSLQDANIPLVLALHYDAAYGIKVELDNPALGAEQGRYAGQLLQAEHGGRGTVVILSLLDVAAGQLRVEGMENGLHEAAPQAEVLGPLNSYTRAQAKATMQSLIANGTHFDAILTSTDSAALGAIDALKDANLTPEDVFIVSANDEEPVNSYIHEGYYVRGSVVIDANVNAQLLMAGIVKALAGSPVAEYLILPSGPLVTAETP